MKQKNILVTGNNTATDQAIVTQLLALNHSVLTHFDITGNTAQFNLSMNGVSEFSLGANTLQHDIQQTLHLLESHNTPLDALIITLETYAGTLVKPNTKNSINDQHANDTVSDFIDIENLDSKAIRHLLEYNTALSIEICQAAKSLLMHNGGNIVIMGSLNGNKTVPSAVHFAASKAALTGLSQSLAHELGRYNICVNLVIPGITEETHAGHVPRQHVDNFLKHSALKRLARPAEIAEVICWFALENTYVTAQSIVVDGGL